MRALRLPSRARCQRPWAVSPASMGCLRRCVWSGRDEGPGPQPKQGRDPPGMTQLLHGVGPACAERGIVVKASSELPSDPTTPTPEPAPHHLLGWQLRQGRQLRVDRRRQSHFAALTGAGLLRAAPSLSRGTPCGSRSLSLTSLCGLVRLRSASARKAAKLGRQRWESVPTAPGPQQTSAHDHARTARAALPKQPLMRAYSSGCRGYTQQRQGGASRWRPGSWGRSAASPLFSTHARMALAGILLSLSKTHSKDRFSPTSFREARTRAATRLRPPATSPLAQR
jgi:hypothetical protein